MLRAYIFCMFLLNANLFLNAQNEFGLVGKTKGQVYHELGNPIRSYHPSDNPFSTCFRYERSDGSTIEIQFSATTGRGLFVNVEYPTQPERSCKDLKNEVIASLRSMGFKYWKKDNRTIWYWNSNYIARLEIEYLGGNHAGFDDFALMVKYCENIFNHR